MQEWSIANPDAAAAKTKPRDVPAQAANDVSRKGPAPAQGRPRGSPSTKSVSIHELSSDMMDPDQLAWYDKDGGHLGDAIGFSTEVATYA